jgi:stearoyl-CoA desaturase (delta-9 desaturase)
MTDRVIQPPQKSAHDEYGSSLFTLALPPAAFVKSGTKATLSLLITLAILTASSTALAVAPSGLWPMLWLISATCLTGLYAIGIDCSTDRFLPRGAWATTAHAAIGSLAFLPLLLPFETVRLHIVSSGGTSSIVRGKSDVAWVRFAFLWIADVVRGWVSYFDLAQFKFESPEDVAKARSSILFVYACGGAAFVAAAMHAGVWPIVKYWGVPFALFHLWRNTFASLKPVTYDSQRNCYVFTYYRLPAWIEFLMLDYNFQVPKHFNVDVPCYNLQAVARAVTTSDWARSHMVVFRFGRELFNADTSELPADEGGAAKRKGGKKGARGASPARRVPRTKSGQAAAGQELLDADAERATHGWLQYVTSDLNWLHVPLLTITPALALYGLATTPLLPATMAWTAIYYFFTGFGITGGYHRFWAHKSYEATLAFELMLLAAGTGAVEGSVRWWARDHRAHHRYTDTPRDPYSISKGFWWAHIGWMMHKQDPHKIGRADISDLNKNPLLRFQHRYYVWLALFWGFIFPTLVAGYGWGDFRGGFFFAAVARLVFVHHATFCVNSVAHYIGDHVYADHLSPRDSFITAILTLGEGYHNFHHEFPSDYRNAIRAWQYDPTKWVIRAAAAFGLVYNLHRFPENEIQKGKLQIAQKKLHSKAKGLHWGASAQSLAVVSMEDIVESTDSVVVIDGYVYDVTSFMDQHPGGRGILRNYLRRDATEAFNGLVYNHSNAARNWLDSLRIARLPGAPEEVVPSSKDGSIHYHEHKSAFGNAFNLPYEIDVKKDE